MSVYGLRLVQLFQKVLLFFCQLLPSGLQGLIHSPNTAKSNNRTADAPTDPGKCYLRHCPPLLLRQISYSSDDFRIAVREGCAIGSYCAAVHGGRTREATGGEGAPLSNHPISHGSNLRNRKMDARGGEVKWLTGISPTPVSSQNLFTSLSSSR